MQQGNGTRIIMEKIKYYEDYEHNILLAYEKETEFFVMYIPAQKEWVDCNLSFSNVKHDRILKEISKEEASEKTNGSLPKLMYEKYLSLLRRNMGTRENG